VLRGFVTGGTGGNAALSDHTVYGKTGTTEDQADAWFVGATPQLATAVWFGNRTGAVRGAGFGGDKAAPIFRAFMNVALEGLPDLGLPAPGPVCARPRQFVNENGGRSGAPPVVAPDPAASTTTSSTTTTSTTTTTTPATTTTLKKLPTP